MTRGFFVCGRAAEGATEALLRRFRATAGGAVGAAQNMSSSELSAVASMMAVGADGANTTEAAARDLHLHLPMMHVCSSV